jgi:hypothetical protein
MRLLPFLLALTAAFAQNASISGRVATPDGKPIPRATVRVIGEAVGGTAPAYVEVTGQTGSFSVASLPPGKYTIRPEAYGYTPSHNPKIGYIPVEVSVKAGEARQGVIVGMDPLGVVAGTVVDAAENPLLGMEVRLRAKRPNYRGGEEIVNLGYATTDDRGQFRITQVQAGFYYLQVYEDKDRRTNNSYLRHSRDEQIRSPNASRAYLPTYYPETANIETAAVLEMKGAPIENLVIRMRQSGAHHLRVQVQGGVSGYSAFVRLYADGEPNQPSRQLNAKSWQDGQFETSNVPPGNYRLVATQNPPSGTWVGEAAVNLESDAEISIRLRAPVTITGRFIFNGAVPPGLKIVTTSDDSAGIRMPDPTIREDGSFRFEGVAAARYKLLVAYTDPPSGFYMKSFRIGGREIKDQVIDLTQGNTGPWEFEMMRLPEAQR